MDSTTLDILNEERTDLIREIVVAVVAQVLPEVRQGIGTDYLTEITGIVNKRFDELDTAAETRHSEFVRQTEARFALTATKEELSGVVKSGAENTERISKLEASTDARLKLLEEEGQRLKANDQRRGQEIGEIKASADKTADNAQKTSEAVIELVGQFKTWRTDTDREIGGIKDAQRLDQKTLRETREDVLSNRGELNDMKVTIATETDKFRNRVTSLTENITGLHDAQKTLQTQYVALDTRQEAADLREAEWAAVRSGLRWVFVDPVGRKIGGAFLGLWLFTTLAALYLLFRIAAAGLQIPT